MYYRVDIPTYTYNRAIHYIRVYSHTNISLLIYGEEKLVAWLNDFVNNGYFINALKRYIMKMTNNRRMRAVFCARLSTEYVIFVYLQFFFSPLNHRWITRRSLFYILYTRQCSVYFRIRSTTFFQFSREWIRFEKCDGDIMRRNVSLRN